jgi:hypothetical protein
MAIPTPRIDIDLWASPLPIDPPSWCKTFFLFDFPYWSLPPHSIPPIVLCPWLTLMYWVKLKMLKRMKKYDAIAWFGTRVLLIWYVYAGKTERVMLTTTKCIEAISFSSIIMKGNDEIHACFVLLFQYQIDRLLPWITHILIFMLCLDYMIKIMLGSIPHQKISFYHLPTRGRAGIKLGDADTSPSYL